MSDLKKHNLFPSDFDFNKITTSMNAAADQMRAYCELDVEATLFAYRRFYKQLYRKPKTHACGRTMSWAKYAGSKQNRPKHNWSKKKRARMGWKV